jgi:hypothetical protein
VIDCFHCGRSVYAVDAVFVVAPTNVRVSYDNELYRSVDQFGNSHYSGPRQGGLTVNLESYDHAFKAFHRECFLEVAGSKYAP